MTSTRSSSRASTRASQQAAAQPGAQALNLPNLTHDVLIAMLEVAISDLHTNYDDYPRIRDELDTQFTEGIQECQAGDRDPLKLLRARLHGEWLVFNAWNEHRLGHPEELDDSSRNIAEDVEHFPLRLETVARGFGQIADEFPPIYQSGGDAASGSSDRASNSKGKKKADGDYVPTGTKKSKTGRTVENYDKLSAAPPTNLAFPDGNILVTEVCAFLPNSLKACDLQDRVLGNGLGQLVAAKLINKYRSMERGQITPNSVYRMFKGPINRRAKDDPTHVPSWVKWSTGNHIRDYHDPTNFDPTSVSVSGFRPAVDGKDTSTHDPIPFKDLAVGVQEFPSGNDALDLTRMVKHARDNPSENWEYPDDYTKLLTHIGPAQVVPANYDAARITHWTTAREAASSANTTCRKRDSRGRLQKKLSSDDEEDFEEMDETDSDSEPDFDALNILTGSKRKAKWDDDSDSEDSAPPSRKSKRTKIVPKPRLAQRGPSRLREEVQASDVDSDSGNDGYEGPKRDKGKGKAAPTRRSGRKTNISFSYSFDEDTDEEEEMDGEDGQEGGSTDEE